VKQSQPFSKTAIMEEWEIVAVYSHSHTDFPALGRGISFHILPHTPLVPARVQYKQWAQITIYVTTGSCLIDSSQFVNLHRDCFVDLAE